MIVSLMNCIHTYLLPANKIRKPFTEYSHGQLDMCVTCVDGHAHLHPQLANVRVHPHMSLKKHLSNGFHASSCMVQKCAVGLAFTLTD